MSFSSAVFDIHLTNVFNMLFSCIQIFSQTRYLSLDNIVDADGFAVLAFWRILHHSLPIFFLDFFFFFFFFFLNNSAVIHKVAQCMIPMQIRYILIYFIHHIRTGPLHMFKLFSSWICIPHQPHKVTSGQITVTVSYEQKLVHCSTQNTISNKHPSQNSQ